MNFGKLKGKYFVLYVVWFNFKPYRRRLNARLGVCVKRGENV